MLLLLHAHRVAWQMLKAAKQLTCEEERKEEDEQKILTGLTQFDSEAALLGTAGSRRPAAPDRPLSFVSNVEEDQRPHRVHTCLF